MNQSAKYPLIIALIIIVAIGGAFLYKKYHTSVSTVTAPEQTASTTDASGNTIGIEGIPAGATVTVTDRLNADLFAKTPKPSLTRTLPQGSFTAEQHAILQKQRDSMVALIQANPAAMANWLNLGVVYKEVGDYEGAKIYWSYVATVNPDNLTVHWNLASLYELYIKDATQAEKEFGTVIALDKTYLSAYIELANTYHAAGQNDKAITTLSNGIKANPGATDLVVARAHLYRDLKQVSLARADYTTAISQTKNVDLVQTLTDERNALQ